MSSGERPTGAAKGKQSDTEALCQTPPAPPHPPHPRLTNVVRHDVLFSVSDTVCVLRFNQVWHRE